ncbi:DUF4942 domain-containing protein [Conchiformibius steedae]|uniref:DUF4942 domain-containing protein n=1 Tax=Conchiformibius steedae TaxID=153493 RepID=UPI0026F049D6|nr:DUF4942 domain-containing protein [Conchiformibius steedae]
MFNNQQLSAQSTQLAMGADILPLVAQCRELKEQAQAVLDKLADNNVFNSISNTLKRLDRRGIHGLPDPSRFNIGAVNQTIDAEFWQKVMKQTGLLEYLAAEERNKWHNAIAECEVPEFTEDNIRSHFGSMVKDLPTLFAQRVLGLYRFLSREHLTNNPQGFGKRQIIYITDRWGYTKSEPIGVIHDVRNVLRQLRGEATLPQNDTDAVLYNLIKSSNKGVWCRLDDDVRIKVFQKGTAHLEFSERASDELNHILAVACANQLPPSEQAFYRQQAQRYKQGYKGRGFEKSLLLLNVAALKFCQDLSKLSPQSYYGCYYGTQADEPVAEQDSSAAQPFFCFPCPNDAMVRELVRLTGGEIQSDNASVVYRYNPSSVMRELQIDGVMPEYKSHQFYPTPAAITDVLKDYVGDTTGLRILEPSYGAGDLLGWLNHAEKAQVTAVDISPLAVSVARAQGCGAAHCGDFLEFGEDVEQFDLIVMNPPYTAKQAQAHLAHAKTLLKKPEGQLFAVLPQSALSRDMVVLGTFKGAFDNTSITTYLVEVIV